MKTYKVNVLNNTGDPVNFRSRNKKDEFGTLEEAEKLFGREVEAIEISCNKADEEFDRYFFVEVVEIDGDNIEQIICSGSYRLTI